MDKKYEIYIYIVKEMTAVRFKYGKISLTSKSCNHKVSHCWSGVS